MKLLALITGGRTGSGFLHSILDGHSEVLQLPGELYYDDFYSLIKKENKPKNIAKIFCINYKYFFDSRFNKFERFNKLGNKQNEYFTVDKNKFINEFINLFNLDKKNKLNILINIHLAYAIASGEEIKNKKVLLLHLHHIKRLEVLRGLDYQIIYTIREPKAALASYFSSWSRFNRKIIDPTSYYFNFNRTITGINDLIKFKKKIHVFKMEDMHKKNSEVIKRLCMICKIKYEKIMMLATFKKKKWWGDKAMKKPINGFSKNYKNEINYNLFYNKDLFFIEKLLEKFFKKYSYKTEFGKYKHNSIYLFLPFKMEVLIFLFYLKRFELLLAFKMIYFFFKRIFLFIKFKPKESRYLTN